MTTATAAEPIATDQPDPGPLVVDLFDLADQGPEVDPDDRALPEWWGL